MLRNIATAVVTSAFTLSACHRDRDEERVGPDLTERLGSGEARAGVVTDEAALFGGISAEGRAGDLKIYNDRVQFVIQGLREGDYYVGYAGGVVDADFVRPEAEIGRDAVDEWSGMFGLGRLVEADAIAVLSDGSDGGVARIRVKGKEAPLLLLTGALETPDLIPDLGLEFVTDYVLAPDSWLLQVTTTITATQSGAQIQPGDVIFSALEVMDPWESGVGLDAPASGPRLFAGLVGKKNDVAFGLLPAPGAMLDTGPMTVFSELVQLTAGFGETLDLAAGEKAAYTRYYGVAPDVATLTDAALALAGTATEAVSGTVTAEDGPVAGARVNVLVDGAPYTLAVTGEKGTFSATVPTGASTQVLAVGRGPSLFMDLLAGSGNAAPYAASEIQGMTLGSLADGAIARSHAEARGVGSEDEPLVLGNPGEIVVHTNDGLPFEVRVSFAEGDAAVVDERLVPDRPSGYAALAWSRDGEVRFPIEPGQYELTVHRGIRYELWTGEVEVVAGAEVDVDAELPLAVEATGYLLGDPHAHASPSGDGSIPMEERLVSLAGQGIQLHFGTDHDHLADYRPLLAPLGLDGVLASVVSDEVSPPLRGHMNIYPVDPQSGQPNAGALPWWAEIPVDTQSLFDALRERHGDFILQSNHPLRSGLLNSAKWSPGVIGASDHWSEDFDAIEVMNAGDYNDNLPLFFDLVNRGLTPTAVGVSDSHSHIGGKVGLSATYFGLGTNDVSEYSDDALKEAMHAHRTIVTRGVFLDLSIDPGSTLVSSTTLHVTARSPSWAPVDRLRLFQDGIEIVAIEGTEADFELDPNEDATFVVIAEGDSPMFPLTDETPWAMASPIWFDVDADGWVPPLPPLELE